MESISAIESKIKANQAAGKRLEVRMEKLRAEFWKLRRQLHRAKLAAIVGGEVITAHRGQYPRFDGLVGKLLKVQRTRGVVEFDGAEWSVPLDGLMPAADAALRGELLVMGVAP